MPPAWDGTINRNGFEGQVDCERLGVKVHRAGRLTNARRRRFFIDAPLIDSLLHDLFIKIKII
jgi:glutamine amidotransferase PdxT